MQQFHATSLHFFTYSNYATLWWFVYLDKSCKKLIAIRSSLACFLIWSASIYSQRFSWNVTNVKHQLLRKSTVVAKHLLPKNSYISASMYLASSGVVPWPFLTIHGVIYFCCMSSVLDQWECKNSIDQEVNKFGSVHATISCNFFAFLHV